MLAAFLVQVMVSLEPVGEPDGCSSRPLATADPVFSFEDSVRARPPTRLRPVVSPGGFVRASQARSVPPPPP